MHRDSRTVPLSDDPPLPRHDDRGGHRLGRVERGVDGSLDQGRIQPGRQRGCRQLIAHRPGRRGGVGQVDRQRHWCKVHGLFTQRQCDAPLIPEPRGGPGHAVGQCEVDALILPIDDPLDHLRAVLVRSGKKADVLGREVWVEAGDEDSRAQRLGETGCVVNERISGGRSILRVQLQRRRSLEQLLELDRGERRVHRSQSPGGREQNNRERQRQDAGTDLLRYCWWTGLTVH